MRLPTYLVHYRQPEWCASAVASLVAAGADVTVVDNSRDLVLATAAEIVRPGRNLGYTGGVNLALRRWLETDAVYVLVGAHDLHVAPDALDRITAAADKHSDYGVLTLDMDEGTARGDLVAEDDDLAEHTWVSGAALLIRRECAQQIGLLDEDYGSYAEDVEYGLRARKAGWRVGVVKGATGWTLGSGNWAYAWRMTHANYLLMDVKRSDWKAFAHRTWFLLRSAAKARNRLDRQGYGLGLLIGFRKVALWLIHGRPRPRTWS